MEDHEADLEVVARRLRRARFAIDNTKQQAKEVADRCIAQGMSEYTVARTLGVDRMTLRKWLGK
ncbi:MAG: hypothetical protein WBG75_21670 [Mycolicibacter algericus]|uniref:hypothetical protein n=1 Tax=Mycolicibacter algericus TaxID=1288388 RepID=UPI003C7418A4